MTFLKGGAGDDLLDGGAGRDVLSGEGEAVTTADASYDNGGVDGSDTFVTRAGDGGSSEATADVITDFTDGSDLIGLDGLTFGQLTIMQGTGDYASDTNRQVRHRVLVCYPERRSEQCNPIWI
jgi:Ca2+-binding RTX toxin-like protein